MIAENNMVSINYEVIDALTKESVDNNKGGKPLEFIIGHSQVIDGLEQQIKNANVGDSLEFSVAPELAYGARNPELMQEVGIEQFGDIQLEKGMTLFGQAENGMPVQVIVADFNDTSVLIDYNHPLAGKTLEFKVEVLSAREATDDELVAGMSGGHGCCGGGGGGCGCSGGRHGGGGHGCCGGGH